jgi:hypothetical protein
VNDPLPTLDANDWTHRANMEATAILDACGIHRSIPYSDAVSLLAVAWLQGLNLQAHSTLNGAEIALQRLREDLAA